MQLTGFACKGGSGPVREGFLALGELTAVIGANDAGKSRFVRSFASSLATATDPEDRHSVFFATHTDAETKSLLWNLEEWNDSLGGFSFTRDDVVPSTLVAVRELHSEDEFPGWMEVRKRA